MQLRKKLIPFLIAILLFVCCTKEGDTIYKPNPDEEQPSTAPLALAVGTGTWVIAAVIPKYLSQRLEIIIKGRKL